MVRPHHNIARVGMLILSTVTLALSVSEEINKLLSTKCTPFQHKISDLKLKQLGLLTRAGAFLYTAAGLYVLSGIIGALLETRSFYDIPSLSLYAGTIFLFMALVLLVIFAYKAVTIRRIQFDNNHNL